MLKVVGTNVVSERWKGLVVCWRDLELAESMAKCTCIVPLFPWRQLSNVHTYTCVDEDNNFTDINMHSGIVNLFHPLCFGNTLPKIF